jgi:hypothetical protein
VKSDIVRRLVGTERAGAPYYPLFMVGAEGMPDAQIKDMATEREAFVMDLRHNKVMTASPHQMRTFYGENYFWWRGMWFTFNDNVPAILEMADREEGPMVALELVLALHPVLLVAHFKDAKRCARKHVAEYAARAWDVQVVEVTEDSPVEVQAKLL